MRREGTRTKALCYSGDSASKAALKPQRTKKISPPFCEKSRFEVGHERSSAGELELGWDVKGDKAILFWEVPGSVAEEDACVSDAA